MRLTNILFTFIAAIAFTACSSGGGDDTQTGDDTQDIDANTTPDPDAEVNPPGNPLGTSCTPDAADPQGQGSCPAGYTCLNLTGGTGPWCSKTCVDENDTSCDVGFDQPGLGFCLWQVDFDGKGTGNPPVNYCGIVCNDISAGICTDCNDACPANYLQCTQALGGGVAEGCI